MASEEHKQLADIIKQVHVNLRISARNVGASQAWEEHCQQKETLSQYAEAMRKLATDHWGHNSDKKVYSRIQWIVEQSVEYFKTGGCYTEKAKELRRIMNVENSVKCKTCADGDEYHLPTDLILLDVGSCYNPFKEFPYFKVLPIDLKPACSDVFEADFLKLPVSRGKMTTEDITKVMPIRSLPEKHFNIVVFSLLLEYMPSCHQRFLCCQKAYQILKTDGILFIISPDSKHASANSSLMKQWRICLAYLGFTRLVYEKHPHIHCMAFRKNSPKSSISREWAQKVFAREHGYSINKSPHTLPELLKIPQDDTVYISKPVKEMKIRSDEDNCELVEMFQALPEELELF